MIKIFSVPIKTSISCKYFLMARRSCAIKKYLPANPLISIINAIAVAIARLISEGNSNQPFILLMTQFKMSAVSVQAQCAVNLFEFCDSKGKQAIFRE